MTRQELLVRTPFHLWCDIEVSIKYTCLQGHENFDIQSINIAADSGSPGIAAVAVTAVKPKKPMLHGLVSKR